MNQTFDRYLSLVEEALRQALPQPEESSPTAPVEEAMAYSLFVGGKRIRPVLALGFCQLCGGAPEQALPFACAVEMVHTYSLIHDDLPCMDDDDMRRGKPTNHKVYGEAMALLAGDGLLTKAFETALSFAGPAEDAVRGARILAQCAGAAGMVGGQCIDLDSEGKDVDLSLLREMDQGKTVALISAACQMGCVAAGAGEAQLESARRYAEGVGMAFQIQDDILDYTRGAHTGKPSNNDLREHKITLPLLLLLDRSDKARQDEIRELLARCHEDETAVDTLQAAVEGKGCLQEASKVMHGYLQRAASLLAAWPDGPVRTALVNLCAYIAERNR